MAEISGKTVKKFDRAAALISRVLVVMEEVKLHLFDEFVLDTARGSLLRAGQPIHLRPQAYKTLKYLVENRGRLISKDRLIEEVWEGRAVTDDSLVQCLRDVRQALGASGNQYLKNERGRGYVFDPGNFDTGKTVSTHEQIEFVRMVVEAEDEDELEATQPKLSGTPATRASVHAKNIRRKLVLTAGFVVLAVAGFSGYRFLTSQPSALTPVTSIAVLPFVNESGNSDLEYLSDGVSESLINSLSISPT